MVKSILLATTALITVSLSENLQASNFRYSYLGIDLAVTEFDEPIIFGNTEYGGVSGLALSGAYQVDDSVAIWLNSSTLSGEGDQTDITYVETLFGLSFPFPISDRMDITPILGQAVLGAEACSGNLCAEEDFDSLFWGVHSRAWLALGLVEVEGTWINPVEDEIDASLSLGIAVWLNDNNSIRYRFSADDGDSNYALGYRYTW